MATKYNPLRERMRATFAAGIVDEPRIERVDREKGVLHGVQITLEGEALGHGVNLDRAFCEAVAEQGNAMGDAGIKVRFGHPAMCSDALGTYLGRAKNFTVGEVTRKDTGAKACGVFADVELDPNADRRDWVLNMAESAPDTFGQSIVFTYGDLKSTDADGKEIFRSSFDSDDAFAEAAGDAVVYAVLGKLLGTDFTDTPAATDGVFSGDTLASQAEQALADHPELAETLKKQPGKVVEFLSRVGLLADTEAKRVAGLQAAKDKQIAELAAELATVRESAAAAETLTAERDRLAADFETLKTERDRLAADLEAAEADAEHLRTEGATLVKELANATARADEAQAALAVAEDRYRAQIGGALQITDKAMDSKSARQRLAELPPSERAAFYAAHKAEIDNHK